MPANGENDFKVSEMTLKIIHELRLLTENSRRKNKTQPGQNRQPQHTVRH